MENVITLLPPFSHFYNIVFENWHMYMIGERSEPLSDKLGGEICIATRALVCIYLYNMRTA